MVQLSHPYITTGKALALTKWTLVGKMMSLLFDSLSRFVISLLPRRKRLLVLWLQSLSAVILEPKKMKSDTVSTVYLFAMKWWDWMPLSSFFECRVLSQLFHSPLFTFIKRLFSSSSFCAIKVVSSAYLRLLIFLPAIWFPACASSSPAFRMMYAAYS